jgi:hypothetical protein
VREFVIEVEFIGADGRVTGTRRFIVGKAGGTSCQASQCREQTLLKVLTGAMRKAR